MKNPLDLFKYHQIDNKSDKAIFLFHGTGGNETDLLPLVEPFLKSHTIVGLKGNVVENGMPRFFERNEEGVFDQKSIAEETEKLVQFLKEWTKINKIKTENITFVGYSNGANFLLAMLLNYPELITKAALLHAMIPFDPKEIDLSKHKIFISWGQYDTMILPSLSKLTVEVLQALGAKPTVCIMPSGHNITSYEVDQLHTFIKTG